MIHKQVSYVILFFALCIVLASAEYQLRAQSLPKSLDNANNSAAYLETTNPSVSVRRNDPNVTFSIKDSTYASAFADVVGILKRKNSCSEFFGGSEPALEVFNQLASQMTKTYISQNVGIRMSGEYMLINEYGTKLRYRLFKKAEVNVRGPFYRRKIFPNEPPIRFVGVFPPNTREARALMLLHELGHLIAVSPGHWLLPDDGNDDAKSQKNTETIQEYCVDTISHLPRMK